MVDESIDHENDFKCNVTQVMVYSNFRSGARAFLNEK